MFLCEFAKALIRLVGVMIRSIVSSVSGEEAVSVVALGETRGVVDEDTRADKRPSLV